MNSHRRRDERRRPRRIADLLHECRQLDRAAQQGVDHEPRLVETQVFHAHPRLRAHDAARSIGADEVARPYDSLRVVFEISNSHRHVIVVLLEADDLVRQVHHDVGCTIDTGAQRSLEVGLVEHPALPFQRVEAEQGVAVGVDEVHALDRRARRQHVVGHPELVQHPHDLGVQVGGARQVVHGCRRLEHGGAQSGLTE
jgi:hypothetical protein